MEEDLEKLLEQYKTLSKKIKELNEEREKLIESVRVKGVKTLTSANKQIWDEIHEKKKELDEVKEERRKINDHILKFRREAKKSGSK